MSLWFPDSDDIITAHEYAGFISRVRTPGFHRSSDSGLKTLEDIVEKAKSQNDLYSSAAVYLRDIIKKHPFSDGNHRTAYIISLQYIRENGGTFVPEETLNDDAIADALKKVKLKSIEEVANWIETGEF